MQTFRDKIHDDSDSDEFEDNRSESIKQRHRRELEQAERENRENTSALLELRDMDDELNTMRNLFSEQEVAIKIMKENYEKPELRAYTENGREFLDEALKRLQEYRKQVHDMLERVDGTKKDVVLPYLIYWLPSGTMSLMNLCSTRSSRKWCSVKPK